MKVGKNSMSKSLCDRIETGARRAFLDYAKPNGGTTVSGTLFDEVFDDTEAQKEAIKIVDRIWDAQGLTGRG